LLCLTLTTKTPEKIKNLKISGTTYNSISLSWNKSQNANMYKIYRKSDKEAKLVKVTKGLSFTDKNLTTGKKYTYSIKACNNIKK
jgi:fibronectin type 3 domain-containing protein